MLKINSKERRTQIIKRLKETNKPIKGTEMATVFNVSRQVIVQDIALLRAEGEDIMATPQGYVMPQQDRSKLTKTIVSKHKTYEEMKEELEIMIHYGARVVDVIVEHPVYGEIRGVLDIGYKKELEEFIKKIKTEKAEPLSTLTEGIHIHTIEIPEEENFNKMKQELKNKGYLIDE